MDLRKDYTLEISIHRSLAGPDVIVSSHLGARVISIHRSLAGPDTAV